MGLKTNKDEVLVVVVLLLVFSIVGYLQQKYRLGWRTQLYDMRQEHRR